MNIEDYKNCLLGKGIPTGNLTAVYDFTGGSGNYVYNSLYSEAAHFLSGSMRADKIPGVIVKNTVGLPKMLTGLISGTELYRVGKNNPNADFTFILDYSTDLCNASGEASQILASSNEQGTGISGFALGVTQSNRLFFEYYSGPTKKSYTIDKELSDRNSVFLNVHNSDQATLGFYNYEADQLVSNSLSIPGYTHSDTLYLGGLYNYSGTTHTGLEGVNKEFILFGDSIDAPNLIESCIDCMFFTGFSDNVTTTLFDQFKATGFNFSTQNISGNTGVTYFIQTVPHPTGGTTDLLVGSGMSGIIDTIDYITPMTGFAGSGTSVTTSRSFLYDTTTGGKSIYGDKTLAFVTSLVSGDFVETYYYDKPIPNFNLTTDNFVLDKGSFNSVLLFHNGLLNIEGVDFNIGNENIFAGESIQGYDGSDAFAYNLLNEDIITSEFSGMWSRSRILLNSGDVAESGGLGTRYYYPAASQYHEAADNNQIYITGISGQSLTGYDLFINGQKLIEGYDYHTGTTGIYPSVILSGADMPDFSSDVVRTGSGNVSGWDSNPPSGLSSVESSLLVFVQKTTGAQMSRKVTRFEADGSTVKLTGYSEQVWVNGIRQIEGANYIKTYPCSPTSGHYSFTNDLFLFYNNQSTFFNIE